MREMLTAAYNSNEGLYAFLCEKRRAAEELAVLATACQVATATAKHNASVAYIDALLRTPHPSPSQVDELFLMLKGLDPHLK